MELTEKWLKMLWKPLLLWVSLRPWPIKAGFQREGHNFCDPTIRILIRTGVPFDLTSTVADERSLCGSSNLATFYCHIQHHIPPCQKVVHLYSENYPFLVPKFFGFFWLAGEFSYSKRELVMLYFTFGGCPSSPVPSTPGIEANVLSFKCDWLSSCREYSVAFAPLFCDPTVTGAGQLVP